MSKYEDLIDEEITVFEEVLFNSIKKEIRFDENAQLIDTKYVANLGKIISTFLPKIKQFFKELQVKIDEIDNKLVELEGRISQLEQPPIEK